MTAPGDDGFDAGGLVDDGFDAEGGLVFWHPVDDAPIDETFLPWGPVAAGSSDDTRVRVRNTSDGYTAAAITIAVAGPADDTTGDASGQHLVSVDGDTFAGTAELGDLLPQATSEPVVLRRVTAPDAPAGPAAFTLTATAGTWTPTAAAGQLTAAAATGGDVHDPDAAQPLLDDPEEQMGDVEDSDDRQADPAEPVGDPGPLPEDPGEPTAGGDVGGQP